MTNEDEVIVPEPETVPEPEVVTPEPETPEEPEVDYRGKLNATNHFLEKEGYTFKEGKWVPPTKPIPDAAAPAASSIADAAALLKADVHEEDIERVEKFARAEGITIREALKSDELKAILSVRAEKRSTANAANVSNVRRGPSKITPEALLDAASNGKLPDDEADIEALIAAKSKKK